MKPIQNHPDIFLRLHAKPGNNHPLYFAFHDITVAEGLDGLDDEYRKSSDRNLVRNRKIPLPPLSDGESLDNWFAVDTVADGTCLIHSFLMALSPLYRSVDAIEQGRLGRLYRTYLAEQFCTHFDNYLPKEFYVETFGEITIHDTERIIVEKLQFISELNHTTKDKVKKAKVEECIENIKEYAYDKYRSEKGKEKDKEKDKDKGESIANYFKLGEIKTHLSTESIFFLCSYFNIGVILFKINDTGTTLQTIPLEYDPNLYYIGMLNKVTHYDTVVRTKGLFFLNMDQHMHTDDCVERIYKYKNQINAPQSTLVNQLNSFSKKDPNYIELKHDFSIDKKYNEKLYALSKLLSPELWSQNINPVNVLRKKNL